jgi:hypothetical protein
MQKIQFGVIIVLIGIIVYLQECKVNRPIPCNPVKIVGRDTQYIPVVEEHSKIPIPVSVIPATKVIHDTLISGRDTLYIKVDTAAILNDYFATRYYEDSTKTKYGTVFVKDSVRTNRIVSRVWSANFRLPIVTIKEIVKPKTQLYIGGTLLGNKTSLLYGAGPSLILKNKKDQMYGVGVMYTAGGQIYYNGSLYFKISF